MKWIPELFSSKRPARIHNPVRHLQFDPSRCCPPQGQTGFGRICTSTGDYLSHSLNTVRFCRKYTIARIYILPTSHQDEAKMWKEVSQVTNAGETYRCDVCGMVVEVKEGGGGELVCCDQPMEKVSWLEVFSPKHAPAEAAAGKPRTWRGSSIVKHVCLHRRSLSPLFFQTLAHYQWHKYAHHPRK